MLLETLPAQEKLMRKILCYFGFHVKEFEAAERVGETGGQMVKGSKIYNSLFKCTLYRKGMVGYKGTEIALDIAVELC